MPYTIITSETLTWGKSTLAKLYTLSVAYNVDKISLSLYIYHRKLTIDRFTTAESKRTLANDLKLSYRTYTKYIYEMPPQIVFNGNENFFVPVEWNVLRQMVFQRLNMGYSYTQVNNWVRVLLYFIYNCGRFHLFNKGMNQMVKELEMNRSEAISNIEDLLVRGIVQRAFNGYKNKSGFGVVSGYILGNTSLLAAEFYEVWKK